MVWKLLNVCLWLVCGAWLSLLVVSSTAVATGDANEPVCPTETEASPGFRSYLPDCRAYELVTPPYKEGARVVLDAVSPDASQAIVQSLGNFGDAGNAQDTEGTHYNLTRRASGWAAANVELPGSQFPWDYYLDATPDLGTTLWKARAASQSVFALDFWERESDGALHDLGPLLPPSETAGPAGLGGPPLSPITLVTYRGASSDLAKVLFTSAEGRWPGDTTEYEADSLYEYTAGQGSPPVLVGVGDEGHLIGECGVDLGSSIAGGGTASSAVSANGSVVFFTVRGAREDSCALKQPRVNELFARIDQSSTVAISEPAPNAAWCTEASCVENTSIANEQADYRDAEYVRASEDGSKVFFTSTQQLTNGASEDSTSSDSATANQGRGCGETSGPGGCNLYEAELGEEATTKEPYLKYLALLSGGNPDPQVQGVVGVSEDGSHVYFVAKGLLTGSQTNEFRDAAQAGENNLYVVERDTTYPAGKVTFIATLNDLDEADWNGEVGEGIGKTATTTPAGQFLVFPSVADLTPDDTSTAQQIFRYDSQTGELVRISIGENGFNEDGNTDALPAEIPPDPAGRTVARAPYAISADGAYVVFQSADGLTPSALNAQPTNESGVLAQNVYEYHDGTVSLVSDGQDTSTFEDESSVRLEGTTEAGGDIFFQTADPLVPQDGDTQRDIYDARVDGGFPFEQSPVGCQGEECQGALAESPTLPSSGSASYSGSGNLLPTLVKVAPTTKAKPLTRAQKLAKALKVCHADKRRRKRTVCEARARKQYGAKASREGGKS